MNDNRKSDPSGLLEILREQENSRTRSHRDWVIREEAARIIINLWPAMIPRESVDAHKLDVNLEREFGSKLDTAQLVDAIPDEVRGGLEGPRLLAHALKQDRMIAYIGGTLKIPEARRITQIYRLWFAEQHLAAEVAGSTAEAEWCVRQLAILMSKAAGIDRVWADFEPHVETVQYRTTTVVDLKTDFTRMLAPSVRHFFESEVGGQNGFGVKMSGFDWKPDSANSPVSMTPHFNVVAGLKRVEMAVNMFDPVSGLSRSADIDVFTHTSKDINGSRVKVSSELPSADHQRFVDRLITALTAAG